MIITYLGVKLEVTFEYHEAQCGHRDSFGAPEEPDEDAYIEVVTVCTEHGDDITELLRTEDFNELIKLAEGMKNDH